ncbi:MAG: hypothetical protein LUC97_01970 [Clostridiales bacterium]|nr:hypothetical protein [Clostridiales bacterium]
MKKTMYECECERNNISPRQFFSYCKRKLKEKGCDIEIWASYEDWIDEENEYSRMAHYDEGRNSICTQRAYEWQIYSSQEYNFILEFEFDDDKRGHGYMYAVEFE